MTIVIDNERSGTSEAKASRAWLRRTGLLLAILWLGIVVFAAIFAPILAPYDPIAVDLRDVLAWPNATHLLGTDSLGRDVASRLMYGGLGAISGVAIAVSVSVVLGILLGIPAGFRGGVVEAVATRGADVLMTVPGIVVLLTIVAVFGNSLNYAMAALGVLMSAGIFRVARASARSVRDLPYVDAARVAGKGDAYIMFRHVLPNVSRPIVIQAALSASVVLLVQSGLGFLGLGPPPPEPQWGGMIFEASTFINQTTWLLVPSGLAVLLSALSFNVIGDALSSQDKIHAPRLRKPHCKRVSSSSASGPELVPTMGSDHDLERDGPLLAVTDLSVGLEDQGGAPGQILVDRVTFKVAPGATLAIVGESGSGKTVTALAALGLLPDELSVQSGSIRFGGHELSGLGHRAMAEYWGSEIGFISQDPGTALDPCYTIGSQLAEPLARHTTLGLRARHRRAAELLEMVGIPRVEAVLASYPHQISGGMAQRVAIAMALTGAPRLLIADEPTTALDVTTQAEILDLIRRLQADLGMALIIVTHDWGVVSDIATEAVVMYAGQVVETGTAKQLLLAPRHPYTAALLAASPSEEVVADKLPSIPGTVPRPSEWPTGCRFQDRCGFVVDACRTRPVPLALSGGREARCIRVGELQNGVTL